MKMNIKIERRHLLPREVTCDPTFQFRHTGNDKAHVRGLAQTLRSTGSLDPILVWAEQDDTGKATGRLVLLDGGHRLDAYRTAKGHREGIPARVLNGDREEAMVAAVQANSRESLSLTKQEKMDAAWRLVRLPGEAPHRAHCCCSSRDCPTLRGLHAEAMGSHDGSREGSLRALVEGPTG